MNRKKIIAIVVGAAVLLAVGLYVVFGPKKNRFDWSQSYQSTSKEPYGTYVTVELLKKYFPSKKLTIIKKPIERAIPEDSHKNIYVFIGGYAYYEKKSVAELLRFVKKGNTVFISSNWLPSFILQQFAASDSAAGKRPDYLDMYRKTVVLNFSSPKTFEDSEGYTCYYKSIDSVYKNNWGYAYPKLRNAETLGTIEQKFDNFIRIPYGKGYFYLHTTPLIFTNYHAKREKTIEYIEKVFSYFPEGNVYWDDFSRTPYDYSTPPEKPSTSPLAYIFSQPGLQAAWYALLALTLLYLVFTAKRRQRIIPVLEENNNTSLEFAETIGQLYLSRRNHKKLLELKMRIFSEFIRNRYRLVYKDITEEFIKKLSIKAQVSLEETAEIFKIYTNQQYEFQIPAETVIRFHNATENFRKKCK